MRDKRLKALFLTLFLALLLVSAGFLVQGYIRGYFNSADTLREYVGSFGALAPLILIAIQTMQAFLPVIPTFFGYFTGAALFGVWGGFLCNYIGICIGSIIAYSLAKRFGVSFVKRIVGEKSFNKVAHWVESRKNFTTVLWLSMLLPLVPDCVMSYLSALSNIPAKKFIRISIFAKPWCILMYSVLFGTLL